MRARGQPSQVSLSFFYSAAVTPPLQFAVSLHSVTLNGIGHSLVWPWFDTNWGTLSPQERSAIVPIAAKSYGLIGYQQVRPSVEFYKTSYNYYLVFVLLQAHIDEIETFLSAHSSDLVAKVQDSLRRSIENIESNMFWHQHYYDTVENWLTNNSSSANRRAIS